MEHKFLKVRGTLIVGLAICNPNLGRRLRWVLSSVIKFYAHALQKIWNRKPDMLLDRYDRLFA